jgi:hypothetical protein
MLHSSAVPVKLLKLLADFQESSSAAGFALAGGTSLALRFGHRLSVDLDFFTSAPFHPTTLAGQLGFGPESILAQADGTLRLLVDHVKVEFLSHSYPLLAPVEQLDSIRMWSVPDVAAMKLNAISNRGSKKDFYVLAALLDRFDLQTMIGFYEAKYQPASLMMVIRSLAWFEDADSEPDPLSLRHDSWPKVMDRVSSAIRTLR